MTQVKELNTTQAICCLFVHLAVLFLVLFPVGVLVLLVIKYFLHFLFGLFGEFNAGSVNPMFAEDSLPWRVESCTIMNSIGGFVALVVFMIRALLKMGELPSFTQGIVSVHVRLGLRMIALPLFTVFICALTTLAVFLVFSVVDNFIDTYYAVSSIVFLPMAIGSWIWVWHGAWITSLSFTSSVSPDNER